MPSTAPRPPDAGAPLTARGLACRRGERLLFTGLDLTLAAGEVLWVRGANGRGKTSLLRLLTGLATPAEGEIRWHGRALRGAGPAYRERLLYIGHMNGLKDDLNVLESLRFLARIHGRPSDDTVLTAALGRLGLASRRAAPVRSLSQGQRRRVALARLAIDLAVDDTAAPPSVWILDEPYDALDTDGIATLNTLLAAQAARGGSVVLTSHLPMSLTAPLPTVLQLDALSPTARAARSDVPLPA